MYEQINPNLRMIDAQEYIGSLRELVKEGHEVSMIITGASMNPFLIHQRDRIRMSPITTKLKKGDMVFFQRINTQYVMHRILKVRPEGYYLIGDGQYEIEGPIKREQIFAIITAVQRKDKWIKPGDFWWEFFEHIWIHLIPFRRILIKCYGRMLK